MQIKLVKPINFLFFRTETTIPELANFLYVAKELFREAVRKDLTITGPVHWHYFGFKGSPETIFTLEIAIPVSEVDPGDDGVYHFKRADEFKCVSAIHEGSWSDMPATYEKLMKHIADNDLVPIGVNRELYINADFNHPEANVTEIQIGLK